MKIITAFLIILNVTYIMSANTKYDKWQIASFFRGYNVLYETPKTLQDFIDFRNYGGNIFHIQTDGFLSEDPPYDTVQANINGTDMLVSFCREAGIYYVIGVRSGPGAYDTYDESIGLTGESRIWETGNLTEQGLYAEMLRMIIERYREDTLFVGINLVIEPRPKVRFIPANNSQLYKFFLENVFNIHMDQVYNYFITEIRKSDPYIPVIIENFAYSTPELFPAYEINDPYVIYSFHNYQPNEYTKSEVRYSNSYPGVYWNLTLLSRRLYNRDFFEQTVFKRVEEFQQMIGGKPVFMGECGLLLPQFGSADYITDVLEICKSKGWHFALWDWRRRQGEFWNIEGFGGDSNKTWKGVLENFHAPPVPDLILPEDGDTIYSSSLNLSWDSLTSFTKYDLIITGSDSNIVIERYGLSRSSFSILFNFLPGYYRWKVRSFNPGRFPENYSLWSGERIFFIPGITGVNENPVNPYDFTLMVNYPNPFNSTTHINYKIGKTSHVFLSFFNAEGREILNFSKVHRTGSYVYIFRSENLASGIYFYKLTAYDVGTNHILYQASRKMILLK